MTDDDQLLFLIVAGAGLWYWSQQRQAAPQLQPAWRSSSSSSSYRRPPAAVVPAAAVVVSTPAQLVSAYLTGLDADWLQDSTGNRLFVNPGDVANIAAATGQPISAVQAALQARGWPITA